MTAEKSVSDPKRKFTTGLLTALMGKLEMHELEVTWGRAVRVWWALTWRSGLLGIVLAIGLAVIGGLVIFIAVIGEERAAAFDRSIGPTLFFMVVGSAIYLVIVRRVLRMKWKTFRIVLVPIADGDSPADVTPIGSGF